MNKYQSLSCVALMLFISGCASFKADHITYKDPNGLIVAEVNSPDYFALGKNITVDLNKGEVKSESAGFWETLATAVATAMLLL